MQNDSFLKLPENRRNEILRIAAEEFIQCGYSGASTNTITKRAGISKGILFHYFGNKKGLYIYLLNDMAEHLVSHTSALKAETPGNTLYDSIAALFNAKTAYFNAYPLELTFMERAGQEVSEEVRPEILGIMKGIYTVMRGRRVEAAESAINQSRLRAGVTREQAVDCIMLAMEALDARFSALYRGRGSEIMTNPGPILDATRLFLEVVCRGLFEEPAG